MLRGLAIMLFVVLLLVAYLIAGWLVARKYFEQRHGVAMEPGEPEVVVTLRHPQMCDHFQHIALRSRSTAHEGIDARRTTSGAQAQSEPPRPRPTPVAATATADSGKSKARERPVETAKSPPDYAEPVGRWLDSLAQARSSLDRALTDAHLAEMGPPPLPPRYGSPSAQFIIRHVEVKTYTKLLADHRSIEAWVAYGNAEKVNRPDEMERAHCEAQFWDYVAAWLDQL